MNTIGLDSKKAKELVDKLNILLSDYQIFYQNLRSYHWNIKGENFFELHAKFEQFYNDAQQKIDEIAERVLTLGGKPFHTFSHYIQYSDIKEREEVEDGKTAIAFIVDSIQKLLSHERKILELASVAKDEGSLSLMSDYISEQEKTLWMLNAYLGR